MSDVFKMTADQFQIGVGCNDARRMQWFNAFNAAMALYAIDTPLRAAHFLAQVGHESLGLVYTKEIWGPTAQQLKYDPASGSQLSKDLGNVNIGDGRKYMGRCFIQETGLANYKRMSILLGKDFVNNPELLEQGTYPALGAAASWHDKGLNALADTGNVVAVTKRVNGGTNGLDDRIKRTATNLKAFGC